MTGGDELPGAAVEAFYNQFLRAAESGGYRLNPDKEFTLALMRGLLVNKGRYSYPSCPCRLAAGEKAQDLDIVCPCDYRDADLSQYGSCYCGLYVSEAIFRGTAKLTPVPERRLPEGSIGPSVTAVAGPGLSLKYPVWRCKVCGYLCARDEPPGVCPVCKADEERFERFL